MNNFLIQASVSPERVADLLTTAFETTTWAKVDNWRSPEVKGDTTSRWVDDMKDRGHQNYTLAALLPKGQVTIVDHHDEDRRHYMLDRRKITDGLTRFVSHPQWNEFVKENEDAITADVFLQLCVFGEVRYG